jgi:heat-inducible transcriptional repressor
VATRGSSELSDRKAAILSALVKHYIRTGEPVGSEMLATASGLGVSSATIRTELAALEELGYLTQAHTSAGRAPTDLAYRYFVNTLPGRPRLRETERRAVVAFFDEALADVDEILRGTTQLLSRLTRYASLALAPSSVESRIVRCELIGLGSATLLLVVSDAGRVEKRALELGLEDDDLERLSRLIMDATRGTTLGDASAELRRRAASVSDDTAVLERVAQALDQMERSGPPDHVVLGGVANIASEQAFERRETFRQVYETLERESAILRILREAATSTPLSVTIGHENALPEMWEASVIAAPFGVSGATGTIGVVGPTRMDYVSAISAVRIVAERLSAAVEALRA